MKNCRRRLLCILLSATLPITVLSLPVFWGCKSDEVRSTIQRVEEGLILSEGNGLTISREGENQPLQRMRLVDRMKYHKVPGVSIAVINNHRIEWAKGYGVEEAGGAKRVTPETLFQAASISKPVSAMAALHLVQEGFINLDEDVNSKLVSWKIPENEFTSERKVTLRMLLSHGAGVTVSWFKGYAQDGIIPTLLQILDGEEPAHSDAIRVDITPGSKYRYSGGGYCVVQQLLSDLAGEDFPLVMEEIVLKRLNMSHSTFEQPLPEDREIFASTGHRSDGTSVKGKWHNYPEMAAAGLWTTATDLALFALELMESRSGKSNKVLSQNMTNEMLTPIYECMALGLVVRPDGKNLHFLHSGSNKGFRCILVAYPEKSQGVVIMTNSDNGDKLYFEILRSIFNEYDWEYMAI